jgi:hypothetical protein
MESILKLVFFDRGYVTLFCFDFDDIYQKRLSLRILTKKKYDWRHYKRNQLVFPLYSIHVLFSFCQDNSTLRLSRTIKKATSEQPFGSVVPATFQPFVFPIV